MAVAGSTAFVADPGPGTTDEHPDPQAAGRVLGWFMPKKRALLVPYGVGTVDQLLLGVLYARHFFLRLFALSGKTVIFDEVHAYDTYMNTVFERLLGWLRALDVQVVVLSATLPSHTRTRLLRAWGAAEAEPPGAAGAAVDYPVAWHAHGGAARALPFAPTPGREQRLTFRWCSPDVAAVAAQARALLAQGATVIVVCNQVDRAQQVFQLLDCDPPVLADGRVLPAADRHLLHARMPQAWRKTRETAALARFGKDRPPQPALLVGTQVVEQSLDLDADAMLTDLAPIDLLLQRAGRLHRHQRERPAGFAAPVLYLAAPEIHPDRLPDVDAVSGRGHIYPRPVLWKTYASLRSLGGWALPLGDATYPGYRALIEGVYGDLEAAPAALMAAEQMRYQQAAQAWADKARSQEAEATRRIVPPPRRLHNLFTFEKAELVEDEDAAKSQLPLHLLAATRNPEGLSAEVLLLHRTPTGWATEAGGRTVLPRKGAKLLNLATIRALFGAAVRLSHPAVVLTLLDTPHPEWQALQQQHKLLQRFHLLELDAGATQVGRYQLRLDKRLGLVIEKQADPPETTVSQRGEAAEIQPPTT